jgi:YHS domain-containing protein
VPIKVEADASPAITHAFRVEQFPTDVVLSPQGEVIAKLSCPNTADGSLGQLQALSRHFRQSKVAASPALQQGPVNAAYANLPTAGPATPASAQVEAAPMSIRYGAAANPAPPAGQTPNSVVQRVAPQPQMNPYVPQTAAVGQAQAVYAPQAAASSATDATPPANAMPRSYQAPVAANQPGSPPTPPAGPPTPPVVAPSHAVAGPPQPRTAVPWTPQLPPGAPPVGLEGYCPVTLKAFRKWAPGNPAYGAIHRGRTYLFVGPRERDQFLADPDGYSPVFAGYDPVLLLEKRQSVPGSRRFGYEFDGRFYLFASKETMEKFGTSPEIARTYASGVRQAMNRIDMAAAAGPARR